MGELVLRVRPGRECRVCGESVRALMMRHRRGLDGHDTICRSCHRVQCRVRAAARRSRSAEQVKQVRQARYPDGRKRCSGCRQDRALDEFYTNPGQLDGLNSRCADCNSAGVRRSHAKNRQRSENALKAILASRYPDGLRKCRGGHDAPLEAFGRNAQAPDGLRDYCRTCHTEREVARKAKRHLSAWEAAGIDPTYCYLDGREIGPDDRHADHVVPVVLVGDHQHVLPACIRCNLSKGARPLPEALQAIAARDGMIVYSDELRYALQLDQLQRLGLDVEPETPAALARWLREEAEIDPDWERVERWGSGAAM